MINSFFIQHLVHVRNCSGSLGRLTVGKIVENGYSPEAYFLEWIEITSTFHTHFRSWGKWNIFNSRKSQSISSWYLPEARENPGAVFTWGLEELPQVCSDAWEAGVGFLWQHSLALGPTCAPRPARQLQTLAGKTGASRRSGRRHLGPDAKPVGRAAKPAFARILKPRCTEEPRARREHTAWTRAVDPGSGSRSPEVPVTLALAGCLLTHVTSLTAATQIRGRRSSPGAPAVRTRLSLTPPPQSHLKLPLSKAGGLGFPQPSSGARW